MSLWLLIPLGDFWIPKREMGTNTPRKRPKQGDSPQNGPQKKSRTNGTAKMESCSSYKNAIKGKYQHVDPDYTYEVGIAMSRARRLSIGDAIEISKYGKGGIVLCSVCRTHWHKSVEGSLISCGRKKVDKWWSSWGSSKKVQGGDAVVAKLKSSYFVSKTDFLAAGFSEYYFSSAFSNIANGSLSPDECTFPHGSKRLLEPCPNGEGCLTFEVSGSARVSVNIQTHVTNILPGQQVKYVVLEPLFSEYGAKKEVLKRAHAGPDSVIDRASSELQSRILQPTSVTEAFMKFDARTSLSVVQESAPNLFTLLKGVLQLPTVVNSHLVAMRLFLIIHLFTLMSADKSENGYNNKEYSGFAKQLLLVQKLSQVSPIPKLLGLPSPRTARRYMRTLISELSEEVVLHEAGKLLKKVDFDNVDIVQKSSGTSANTYHFLCARAHFVNHDDSSATGVDVLQSSQQDVGVTDVWPDTDSDSDGDTTASPDPENDTSGCSGPNFTSISTTAEDCIDPGDANIAATMPSPESIRDTLQAIRCLAFNEESPFPAGNVLSGISLARTKIFEKIFPSAIVQFETNKNVYVFDLLKEATKDLVDDSSVLKETTAIPVLCEIGKSGDIRDVTKYCARLTEFINTRTSGKGKVPVEVDGQLYGAVHDYSLKRELDTGEETCIIPSLGGGHLRWNSVDVLVDIYGDGLLAQVAAFIAAGAEQSAKFVRLLRQKDNRFKLRTVIAAWHFGFVYLLKQFLSDDGDAHQLPTYARFYDYCHSEAAEDGTLGPIINFVFVDGFYVMLEYLASRTGNAAAGWAGRIGCIPLLFCSSHRNYMWHSLTSILWYVQMSEDDQRCHDESMYVPSRINGFITADEDLEFEIVKTIKTTLRSYSPSSPSDMIKLASAAPTISGRIRDIHNDLSVSQWSQERTHHYQRDARVMSRKAMETPVQKSGETISSVFLYRTDHSVGGRSLIHVHHIGYDVVRTVLANGSFSYLPGRRSKFTVPKFRTFRPLHSKVGRKVKATTSRKLALASVSLPIPLSLYTVQGRNSHKPKAPIFRAWLQAVGVSLSERGQTRDACDHIVVDGMAYIPPVGGTAVNLRTRFMNTVLRIAAGSSNVYVVFDRNPEPDETCKLYTTFQRTEETIVIRDIRDGPIGNIQDDALLGDLHHSRRERAAFIKYLQHTLDGWATTEAPEHLLRVAIEEVGLERSKCCEEWVPIAADRLKLDVNGEGETRTVHLGNAISHLYPHDSVSVASIDSDIIDVTLLNSAVQEIIWGSHVIDCAELELKMVQAFGSSQKAVMSRRLFGSDLSPYFHNASPGRIASFLMKPDIQETIRQNIVSTELLAFLYLAFQVDARKIDRTVCQPSESGNLQLHDLLWSLDENSFDKIPAWEYIRPWADAVMKDELYMRTGRTELDGRPYYKEAGGMISKFITYGPDAISLSPLGIEIRRYKGKFCVYYRRLNSSGKIVRSTLCAPIEDSFQETFENEEGAELSSDEEDNVATDCEFEVL